MHQETVARDLGDLFRSDSFCIPFGLDAGSPLTDLALSAGSLLPTLGVGLNFRRAATPAKRICSRDWEARASLFSQMSGGTLSKADATRNLPT